MSLAVNLYNFLDLTSSITPFEEFKVTPLSSISVSKVVRCIESNMFVKNRSGLNRSDLACTGKKMYKQKGTGSARHNDKSAPQFRGGAVAHSNSTIPKTLTVNKKEKKKVKDYLFLSHLNSLNFCWVSFNEKVDKTSTVSNFLLSKLPDNKKVLFITSTDKYQDISKSSRNIPNCVTKTIETMSVIDLLKNNFLCIDFSLKNNIDTMYDKN